MPNHQTIIHGVFVSILGIGVLITGKPGVGKSELALALIDRGHQLIADDAPQFSCHDGETVIGSCPQLLQNFLEIRRLGVLNIRKIYGNQAVKTSAQLQLIIHLCQDTMADNYMEILNIKIPQLNIPPNQVILVEAAVRNFLLKQAGYDANLDFANQQQRELI